MQQESETMMDTLRKGPLTLARRRTKDVRTQLHVTMNVAHLGLVWFMVVAGLVLVVLGAVRHAPIYTVAALCAFFLSAYSANEYLRQWPEEESA